MSARESHPPLAICAHCGEARGRHVFGNCARGGTRYARKAPSKANPVPAAPAGVALATVDTRAATHDEARVLSRAALSPSIALALPEAVRPHFETSREFLAAAMAENTKRAYLADCEAYGAWCAECGASPLPNARDPQASEAIAVLVASYLSHCAKDRRLKVATLRRRLAAIAKAYRALGYPSPRRHARVLETFQGIERRLGTRPKKVAPVDGEVLRRVLEQINLARLGARRDRALILLGYALANRRSELVGLDVSDVSWRDEGIVVLIRRSKTDQTGRGYEKSVEYNWDEPTMCPVEALKVWLESAQITSGPIFRGVTRQGTVRAGRLSDDVVADIVKKYARAVGLDPSRFSGHSLRAGHVTEAYLRGLPEHRIQEQTGHRSLEILREYKRIADPFARGSSAGVQVNTRRE